jgi:hypothetical protein
MVAYERLQFGATAMALFFFGAIFLYLPAWGTAALLSKVGVRGATIPLWAGFLVCLITWLVWEFVHTPRMPPNFKPGKRFSADYPVLGRISYENHHDRNPSDYPELRW